MGWKKLAHEWAFERFDYILDFHETPDFIEFYGVIGGDHLTYRYYKNNTISEK